MSRIDLGDTLAGSGWPAMPWRKRVWCVKESFDALWLYMQHDLRCTSAKKIKGWLRLLECALTSTIDLCK